MLTFDQLTAEIARLIALLEQQLANVPNKDEIMRTVEALVDYNCQAEEEARS